MHNPWPKTPNLGQSPGPKSQTPQGLSPNSTGPMSKLHRTYVQTHRTYVQTPQDLCPNSQKEGKTWPKSRLTKGQTLEKYSQPLWATQSHSLELHRLTPKTWGYAPAPAPSLSPWEPFLTVSLKNRNINSISPSSKLRPK